MRSLSEREVKTLTMLAADLGPAEIAEIFGVSLGSVYTFVSRAKNKLGTTSLVAAVVRAQALGLIEAGSNKPKVGLTVKAAMAVEKAKSKSRI